MAARLVGNLDAEKRYFLAYLPKRGSCRQHMQLEKTFGHSAFRHPVLAGEFRRRQPSSVLLEKPNGLPFRIPAAQHRLLPPDSRTD